MNTYAVLALCACVATLLSALGKAPLWVAVAILCLLEVARLVPGL